MGADRLRIALAQINVTVGDISGNVARILKIREQAIQRQADFIVFPELAITGYPPEDLVLRPRFQKAAMEAIDTLTAATRNQGPAIIVGGLWPEEGKLYNALWLLDEGKVVHRQAKMRLPNYGVFDEMRVFTLGAMPKLCKWRGHKLGLMVCEDMWGDEPTSALAKQGADLFIVINASPYEMGKAKKRRELAAKHCQESRRPLLYVNLVGGQDELVFDGRSFIMSSEGKYSGRLAAFAEELAVTEWRKDSQGWQCVAAPQTPMLGNYEIMYRAMILGLKDYVEKNRFPGVVIGMSGGVDSALTAAVAVDALGAGRVRGLLMPSRYTSVESSEDATLCAHHLGMRLDTIGIEPAMQAYSAMWKDVFAGLPTDTTEENIQARIRGNLLMAMSNKFGAMVLTTGNKSEMSVGYATLYGDMCGGYSVLKDVYKTTVYLLAEWRNSTRPADFLGPDGEVIPPRILTKAPSAELKANQTDQDTLPPYPVLDGILQGLVESQLSVDEVVRLGYDRAMVEKVSKMLYSAEYKRRQAPPGVKVTGMAFGRDRRYPITNRFVS